MSHRHLQGEVPLFTLLPFNIHEASEIAKCTDALSSVLRGGYPRYLVNDGKIPEFFENYTTTYVERDIHQLLNIKNATLFTTFLKIIVGRIGFILDVTSISNDCGITTKTATEWLSILHNLIKFNERYADKCAEPTVVYSGESDFTCKGVNVRAFPLMSFRNEV